ncbi:hypothetical protein AB1L12_19780 [Peribacillus frigoritolerans]|uniref:HNH endonuclease n=1 Tax=Peribacillus frigoritolerans TaxID=450367 RepID=UPI0039A376D9
MLYSYQYINHDMEKMQEYIDYIFYKVWCNAPSMEYDISLFDHHPSLKEIIEGIYHTEPKGAEFFIKGIQEIFIIFKTLSSSEIYQLKVWYQSNNDIKNLCLNDPALTPSTYSNIKLMNEALGVALKVFFTGLYSHDFLTLKAIADKIGEIGDHYTEFVKKNLKRKCPYCGLLPIDGQYVRTREAYDHYLPKSKYPFATINFKNLAPICGKCNSSGNKGAKDPLHGKDGKRRKAFYSYSANPYNLEISMNLNTNDIRNLTPQDITLTFGPASLEEELETWNELFNIEKRYKAECCEDNAWYWMTQIFEECADKTPSEFLEIRLESAGKYPLNETNFLRKPFLEACKALQIFT